MEVALTSSSPQTSSAAVKAIPIASDSSKPNHSRYRKRRNICLCTCSVLSLLILVLVILALTVFKPKDPTTTVNTFSIKDLDLDIQPLRVDLNLTLGLDVSIRNKNKVGFKYKNCTAALNYRGQQVGSIDLPADEIPSDKTKRMNITLTIMVDRLLSETKFYSDVLAGLMPMNTYIKMSGKVKILGIFKIHVKTTSSCDFNVRISTRSITDQSCTNKAKL
ncbi:hypothetical protein CsatB_003152 [Cannabis sativa]